MTISRLSNSHVGPYFLEESVSQRLIQEKAYFIWKARIEVGGSGDELSDWLRAEKQIKEDYPLLFYRPIGCIVHIIRQRQDWSNDIICPSCCLFIGDRKNFEFCPHLRCPRCGEMLAIE